MHIFHKNYIPYFPPNTQSHSLPPSHLTQETTNFVFIDKPTMSTSPTQKTVSPTNETIPIPCAMDVENDGESINSHSSSVKDCFVAPEKDDDDTSLTVKKRPSGSSLVFLGKKQSKKRSKTRKFFGLSFVLK